VNGDSTRTKKLKLQYKVAAKVPSGNENQLTFLKTLSENVFKYPLPQAVRSLWDNIKFYSNELKCINHKSVYGKITDLCFSSFLLISPAGFVVILTVWLTAFRSQGKADHEEDGLRAENQRLKATIVDMEKQVAEHREMRLAAEKRLRALEMDVDKKKEKEQNEMLGELKSAIKEEFGTLKSQKKVAEHSEKLLIADKRLAELEANMDTKRETENKEMVKQQKSAMKEEIAALKSKVSCEKKTNDAREEMKQLKSKMDEMKVQRDFYLRQTTDLSYFTVNLQRRLYDELMTAEGHPKCRFDLPEYDRRLLMMHPAVLLTLFKRSPPGSSSGPYTVGSPAHT